MTCNGVVISVYLHLISDIFTGHSIAYINQQYDEIVSGLFLVSIYQIHVCYRKNGESDHYGLIVANNSENGNKKRMAVLTAESVESKLVKMDFSGMRENATIDLNREGRRWEGGELNGKPFGFGREYSESDNLVYEGFVF